MSDKPHSIRELTNDDRLVSDLIGFTLMFGIIIVSIGIVSLGGFDDITGFGDRQELSTAERGMQAGAATLENVNRQGDATRNFDLTIGTGNVWVNETAMEFDANNDAVNDIGDNDDDGRLELLSLEHRFDRQPDDVTVNYEGGGVFRSDFIVPRSDPPVQCGADVATLSIANLTVPEDADIDIAVGFNRDLTISPTDLPEESPVAAFAQSVNIEATLVQTELHRFENSDDLTIDVSGTSNPTAWESAMEDAGWGGQADELTCDADEILVQISTIEITDE